jgi:hypothetical protein
MEMVRYVVGAQKSEVRRAVLAVLIAVGLVIGVLSWAYERIADLALRSEVIRITGLMGLVIVATIAIRGFIKIFMANVRTSTPELYEGVRNLLKMLALAVMSLGGCGITLFTMLNRPGGAQYWPVAIAAVFGGTATFCLGYVWKEWRAFRAR